MPVFFFVRSVCVLGIRVKRAFVCIQIRVVMGSFSFSLVVYLFRLVRPYLIHIYIGDCKCLAMIPIARCSMLCARWACASGFPRVAYHYIKLHTISIDRSIIIFLTLPSRDK